jgi:PhzF family phenazine biosynthesis protein
MSLEIFQIDAFTDRAYRGNPAAVCMLEKMPQDAWLQDVAAEMNLSETAFLLPQGDGWRLRWFTPTVEVKLCGHATLAAAHALWEAKLLRGDQEARFHTLSGLLTARREGSWIEMDFPSNPPRPSEVPAPLADALGAAPVSVHSDGWTWLVELRDESAVLAVKPNFPAMKPPYGSAIVTSRSDGPEYDFVCRFFAPALGINEDPVTGYAHCILGPFWAQRLGKTTLVSHQVSARGGIVKVSLAGERVKLSGQAVTVFRGRLQA